MSKRSTPQRLSWLAVSVVASLVMGWLLLVWVGAIMLSTLVGLGNTYTLLGRAGLALVSLVLVGAVGFIMFRTKGQQEQLGAAHPLAVAVASVVVSMLVSFFVGATLLSDVTIGAMGAVAKGIVSIFMAAI